MRMSLLLPLMTLAAGLAACTAADDSDENVGSASSAQTAAEKDVKLGEKNFDHKIHGGNGRACATCHVESDHFTLTPAHVAAALAALPLDDNGQPRYDANPLFQSLDADDFGTNFTRLGQGLARVTLDLPANITVDELPAGARTIKLFRGVPSIEDVALTRKFILVDGRAPTLQAQARGAAADHMQLFTPDNGNRQDGPDDTFFDRIAAYELAQFSSAGVAAASARVDAGEQNVPRAEPADLSPTEQIGRDRFDVRCASCHGGTSLSNGPLTNVPGGGGTTGAFRNVSVSLLNRAQLPVYTFRIRNAQGVITNTVKSPDPGRLLTTGKAPDANRFDVPTVYGISHTAPYFHDNHAQTLEQVMKLYQDDFQRQRNQGNLDPAVSLMSQSEMDAIVAYMKRL